MIRILAIGDFHGRFPEKFKKIVQEENIDLVLSDGDYAGIDEWRPLIKKMFRSLESGKEFSIEEHLGKKKYNALLKKDYAAGKLPLIELNKLNLRVFSVFGNGDWYRSIFNDSNRDYGKTLKKLKNIKDINKGKARFNNLKIVGFGGYMNPDIYFKEKGMGAINSCEEKRVRRRKMLYDLWERQLMRLMKIKPDILLAHYTPLNCLDKMKEKGFALSGSHMGVSSFNRALKKFKPALMICGHMHENQGKCNIGNTLVVNPGAAREGKAAIIEFDDKKKKVIGVKFI